MLTRLTVNGFKNLVDVDVRFGPLTCIVGENGVGKSNLFDAIRFLSALADGTLRGAASSVREEADQLLDARTLFSSSCRQSPKRIHFEAEMIVPRRAVDDFGKEGQAAITFLKYGLGIRYVDAGGHLQIDHESLDYIQKRRAHAHLTFRPSKAWRDSAVVGARRTPFISTIRKPGSGDTRIRLHQDGGATGGARDYRAASLPRTLLSSGNASDSPTVLCARREMASWRRVQLEPSRLRRSSGFGSALRLGAAGENLPAALHRMAQRAPLPGAEAAAVYGRLTDRLQDVAGPIDSIRVARDDRKATLTLMVKAQAKPEFPASALSDGVLRLIALALMGQDTGSQGLICLEEPENGIHPTRIPAMVCLLKSMTTDTARRIGPDNTLRQVIVNTHSPSVVSEVPDDSLLVAEAAGGKMADDEAPKVRFSCLDDTWRTAADGAPIVSKEALHPYLVTRSDAAAPETGAGCSAPDGSAVARKVKDRDDLQLPLPMGRI